MRTFIVILALACAPAIALAQTYCAERDSLVGKLETSYGEAFAGGGMQNASRIVEVWASEDGGTWTILITRADGTSCITASGTAWRKGLPQPEGVAG